MTVLDRLGTAGFGQDLPPNLIHELRRSCFDHLRQLASISPDADVTHALTRFSSCFKCERYKQKQGNELATGLGVNGSSRRPATAQDLSPNADPLCPTNIAPTPSTGLHSNQAYHDLGPPQMMYHYLVWVQLLKYNPTSSSAGLTTEINSFDHQRTIIRQAIHPPATSS
ncbi:hypothetical protein PCANC_10745 [Puccinia coronata f. sp. avenae]|uniref:Uncharacterized protein n=1 Tax=Puccinia coronata f. sp. avenae TaxID=200324 RepID=A0A2N5VSU5_9BASI|nr:hypothetical protein PCANC_10745 [Puccinia coronata f. sp. avenae]